MTPDRWLYEDYPSNVLFWLCDEAKAKQPSFQEKIEAFKKKNIRLVPYSNAFEFKNNFSELGQILRHQNKKYAIVDDLQHFTNPKFNESAAAKIFSEAESMGVVFEIKMVINEPSK